MYDSVFRYQMYKADPITKFPALITVFSAPGYVCDPENKVRWFNYS